MTLLDAYRAFDAVPAERRPPDLPGTVWFAAYMAGAASLSGDLERCRTTADLERAVVAFHGALRAGRIEKPAWHEAATCALAEHLAAQQRRIAESN